MLFTYSIDTAREEMRNITPLVRRALAESGAENGLCVVWCPHTTAGITINENADDDVPHDILLGLAKAFPDRAEFRHIEGNSAAHLKSSCVGAQQTLIIDGGRLLLGRWQGIWFCEFDGPRRRTVHVKIIKE